MAVGEGVPDDKPARPESAAAPLPPRPDREEPEGAATDRVHAGGKEQPAISCSSDDGNYETVEEHAEGQEEPDCLHREKTAGSRPPSRHASSFAHTDVIPRSRRRGLLGRLALIPEVEQPYEYKTGTKWTITAIVALAAAAAPMGSGIFYRKHLWPFRVMQKNSSLTVAFSWPPCHGG